ncbi:Retrovirus Polyprotein [Phytophthora cinnamomi]|uniref:Retrovirus Polyprotein n=1 Tax=Phytophthora cinnamomi TaxID=4785 RepID=UPI00355A75CE|nr:Retrovirus Polyprotein [Phytophthora cinnamomi]
MAAAATGGTTAVRAGTGTDPPAPPGPPAPAAPAASPIPTVIYRDREREKKLRLPKFKGLDESKLTVKAWLKAVKNEPCRQAAILHTEWREHEVLIDMVASFEGEALLWFDTVEDSFVSREDQTYENLSRLLKDRYMKLREIASSNPVDEEWLVDAFLAGMHNTWSATLIRGHRPATLNAAVNAALDQVGEYGEGYGVGLGMAIATQGRRVAATSAVPTMAPDLGNLQFGGGGNLGSVVSGYNNFGVSAGPPHRYDMEGRLVVSKGSTVHQVGGQWDAMVPTGYQIVPVSVGPSRQGASAEGSSKFQTSQRAKQQPAHGQHADSGTAVRHTGTTLKMEGHGGQGKQGGSYNAIEPLRTREERLRNHQRYEASRAQRQAAATRSKEDV